MQALSKIYLDLTLRQLTVLEPFDQKEYALIGRNTKHMYQLGDEVIVKVKATDLIKKHLDFYLIDKVEE